MMLSKTSQVHPTITNTNTFISLPHPIGKSPHRCLCVMMDDTAVNLLHACEHILFSWACKMRGPSAGRFNGFHLNDMGICMERRR